MGSSTGGWEGGGGVLGANKGTGGEEELDGVMKSDIEVERRRPSMPEALK